MTSIATRSSVLAVIPEVTEGTPVAPSAAGQFIAMQPDFDMAPNLEALENEELRSSLGKAKTILGAESPTAGFSHYLRASGVEGQAPGYKQLLKAFFGTETTNGTERATAAASTTTLIKIAGGAGGDFLRGTGMLIKDATNGYRVRVSHSRSTDDITISFAVPTAPGTGVSLGKCAYYSPLNDGSNQTLTVWHYVGNGGAVEVISGCRVVDFSFDATAGQLVNASFGLEGVSHYLNPIEITSSNKNLDFTDDDGTWACSVAVGWYKNPMALASALQTAMQAANAGETPTVTYDNTTGKFNIKTTGTLLSLLWNTGGSGNPIGSAMGYSVAADDTGTAATTGYTSDNALSFAAAYTPSLDSNDPTAGKNHEVMLGDQDDYACFNASNVSFSGSLARRVIESLCAETGISGSVPNERGGELTVTVLLDKYDVDKYSRFQEGTETRFQYTFGAKSGGNWVAGKVGYLYLPTCTVTSFKITPSDGLATMELTLQPFVDSSGNGEMYLGFL